MKFKFNILFDHLWAAYARRATWKYSRICLQKLRQQKPLVITYFDCICFYRVNEIWIKWRIMQNRKWYYCWSCSSVQAQALCLLFAMRSLHWLPIPGRRAVPHIHDAPDPPYGMMNTCVLRTEWHWRKPPAILSLHFNCWHVIAIKLHNALSRPLRT